MENIFDGCTPSAGAVYAVGNFDGVHRGHRRLFRLAAEIAGNAPVVAVTFEGLTRGGGRLTPSPVRDALLREAGADFVLTLDFERVRDITATDFVLRHLAALSPSAVVCGGDFHFGKGGVGDGELLSRLLCPMGVTVAVSEAELEDGVPVSSTGIKKALLEGHVKRAALLLGRSYSLTLPVIRGKGLGHTVGIPTANQSFPEGAFIPRLGVYSTFVEIGGRRYPSVTNIGVRPTVDDGESVNAETYIRGYSGDLYGSALTVTLLDYLREERRFSSLEALAAQVEKDAERAEAELAATT